MKEMLGGRGLSWRTGICHTFIYKGIHSYESPSYPGFLYIYLNMGVAECIKWPSFIVLAQTTRKHQNQCGTCFSPTHPLTLPTFNNTGGMEKIWSQKRVRRRTLHFWLVASIIFLERFRLPGMNKPKGKLWSRAVEGGKENKTFLHF